MHIKTFCTCSRPTYTCQQTSRKFNLISLHTKLSLTKSSACQTQHLIMGIYLDRLLRIAGYCTPYSPAPAAGLTAVKSTIDLTGKDNISRACRIRQRRKADSDGCSFGSSSTTRLSQIHAGLHLNPGPIERRRTDAGLALESRTQDSQNNRPDSGTSSDTNSKKRKQNPSETEISQGLNSYVVKRSRLGEYENYSKVRSLGKGGNAYVNLVVRRSDRALRACKIIRRSPDEPENELPKEASLLNCLLPPHDRIVKMHETILCEDDWHLYMEFYNGGDLTDLVNHYIREKVGVPESLCWHVFSQLSEALAFIHHGYNLGANRCKERWTSVLHADIKPDNVLVQFDERTPDYPSIKLADFGAAYTGPSGRTDLGTYVWQPPEIPRSSKKADVYAVGATIHACKFYSHASSPSSLMRRFADRIFAQSVIMEPIPR